MGAPCICNAMSTALFSRTRQSSNIITKKIAVKLPFDSIFFSVPAFRILFNRLNLRVILSVYMNAPNLNLRVILNVCMNAPN